MSCLWLAASTSVYRARRRRVTTARRYAKIETPLFEDAGLLTGSRGVHRHRPGGDVTLEDPGGHSLTLGPEATAYRPRLRRARDAQPSAARGALVHRAVFRYDRPQSGRYRQYHEFGAEVMGSPRLAAGRRRVDHPAGRLWPARGAGCTAASEPRLDETRQRISTCCAATSAGNGTSLSTRSARGSRGTLAFDSNQRGGTR